MARPGSPLPHATNLRLSAVQYHHLLVLAEQLDCTISAAVRACIERDIDRQADVVDDQTGDRVMGYRALLATADFSAAADEAAAAEARAS